jgi:hypothetical protein
MGRSAELRGTPKRTRIPRLEVGYEEGGDPGAPYGSNPARSADIALPRSVRWSTRPRCLLSRTGAGPENRAGPNDGDRGTKTPIRGLPDAIERRPLAFGNRERENVTGVVHPQVK